MNRTYIGTVTAVIRKILLKQHRGETASDQPSSGSRRTLLIPPVMHNSWSRRILHQGMHLRDIRVGSTANVTEILELEILPNSQIIHALPVSLNGIGSLTQKTPLISRCFRLISIKSRAMS